MAMFCRFDRVYWTYSLGKCGLCTELSSKLYLYSTLYMVSKQIYSDKQENKDSMMQSQLESCALS